MSLWLPRTPTLLHSQYRRHFSANSRSLLLIPSYSRHKDVFVPLRNLRLVSTSPQKTPSQANSSSSSVQSSLDAKPASTLATNTAKPPLLPRVWKSIKEGASHYWHGSKLLVSEVRISSRLQWKLLHGEALTRREKRQLRRTTQDLLRLIPFAVFIVVPFMEFLLPVALKLFPNMLPSTFEDKYAAEEKERKLLRVRLEMAKFLQDTLRESGLKTNAKIVGSDEFKEFFRKIRATGEAPSTENIIKVAKLFDDDLTLDNLSRPQIVSMCRYMGINAFGTDNFLRGTIRGRLERLRIDDQLIDSEGVQELSTHELQQACQARGVRTSGVSPSRLREELQTWIDLHLNNRVSGVLLVLSRAFNFDRKPSDDDGTPLIVKSLESVLSGLPDTLLNEAELEVDSDNASYKQKLEVLQQQEELIEDEEEQEQKEEDARRAKREATERAKREEEARMAQSLLPDSELQHEVEEEDARMTTEQLKELAEALAILSAQSSVMQERTELRALMEENLNTGEDPKSPTTPLAKRIRTMLTKIDAQMSAYDERVGSSLQMISCDPQGRISVRDLERALTVIKHKPDEDVGQAVVRKLDVDQDGYVLLEHVLGLVKEEGLGVVLDDEAKNIIGQGREIKDAPSAPRQDAPAPRKEDIVQE